MTATPYQQSMALVPLRLATAAGLTVTGFEQLVPLGAGAFGITASSIVDAEQHRVEQAAVVWGYSNKGAEIWWHYGEPSVITRRRFAIAVSDAGELTIVNLDVLGAGEAQFESGRF